MYRGGCIVGPSWICTVFFEVGFYNSLGEYRRWKNNHYSEKPVSRIIRIQLVDMSGYTLEVELCRHI